ncbi:probable glucan 1,3-beta-glucosidase A isoform X2 [Rosa chinensis]|uniref:probable glucan 1,3-beta-glucosidase A isoform X2 n=1 Tax=Rosa chinensis TaxID=74649 RepID=UPI001AD8A4D9|nr:probable glucan 1,3-beta-glucosidase A isoform X2 [Rosa chinensis]
MEDLKLPLKSVNLGNWLVVEGWMKPSLFDEIPNKDLLDGTKVQLKSTKLQNYLAAENGGDSIVVINRTAASDWETFRLWRIDENSFNFRVSNKQFVGLSSEGTNRIVAMRDAPGDTETFLIVRKDGEPNRIRIQASNGLFLQAISDTILTADYGGSGWDDSDPSVFTMTIVGSLQGEYQIANGYGPDKAPQVLQDHRNSYITEEDFRFMSSNGLTAVRIPVGWWIACDPTPPKPFVGGSLQALDNAFTWAQKYGLKVIIDLHAVQASQNGMEHSATRDGYLEFGDSSIQDTVEVIDFLAERSNAFKFSHASVQYTHTHTLMKRDCNQQMCRYAKNPALGAIELINEPWAPLVTLDTLKNYYKAGYDAIRKYTSSAYVILSNRLGPADRKELLSFAQGLSKAVIDVHYYSLYSDMFNGFSVQQNIDFIYNQRGSDLAAVTTSDGPLTFVGEWVAEWAINGASMEDYHRFAKAQLDVYGRATFGWAYWSYKCQYNHWSLKWMIENNYIKLN